MNLENVSSLKKLLILRESIDMIANGIRPDMNVIDACYEDLCKDLADYSIILDEIPQDEKSAPINVSTEAEKQFGESYNKLLFELQRLNEREKKNYVCYITTDLKDIKKLNLRIWDDHEGCWVRTYFNKLDLEINMDNDMRFNFTRPKKDVKDLDIDFPDPTKVSNNKPLDQMTKEDYIRAEFGEEAVKKYKQNKDNKKNDK